MADDNADWKRRYYAAEKEIISYLNRLQASHKKNATLKKRVKELNRQIRAARTGGKI